MARSVNKTVSVFQATPRHDFFEYTLNIENYRLPHEYFQRAEKKECKERMKMKSFKKRLKRTMSRRLILISWRNVEEKKANTRKRSK